VATVQGGDQNALVTLLMEAPVTELLRDALVVAHLGAMAVGFGVVLICDLLLVQRLSRTLKRADIEDFRWTHRVIARALVALWITGCTLVAIGTGMDPGNLSPKLVAKIGTVAVLTLTAWMMSRAAIPLLARSVGHSLLTLPLGRKLALAVCAGLSFGGWISAILLGGSKVVRTAEADAIIELLALIHGGTVLTLLAGALGLHGFHLVRDVLQRGHGAPRVSG
jgi:hypothetical protein